MKYYGNSLSKLIEELSRLPGIGSKTAQRLAFYIIDMPEQNVKKLSASILEAKQNLKHCSVCQNITDSDPCKICSKTDRTTDIILVVEEPKNMGAYERTKEYNGTYHVLHGAISPMKGITPDDLRIKELMQRIQKQEVKEVILATNPNVEGETTAMYIKKLLKPLDIRVTRIAHGVPVGGELEYVDEVTLSRALEGRVEF